LRVNDVWESAATPMRPGIAEYQWRVPPEVWVAGVNELLFGVSAAGASGTPRGLELHSVRVTP
jgi:hypothetical protein